MSVFFTKTINIRNILFFAIFLRVLWAVLVPVHPVADSALYNTFAQILAFKHQYAFPDGGLTAYWPVGTAAIYAVLYKLFGLSFYPVVIFNLIIGVATVWLTYKVGLRYLSREVSLLAATIMAMWPVLIQFTTILASELIFNFLILSSLYVWSSKKMPSIPRAILWGALMCVAAYVRPTALPLILLLPIIEWIATRNLKESAISLSIAMLTAIILIAPWAHRNNQVFGHYVPISANGGVNLWMGNNPTSDGGYTPLPDVEFENEAVRDQHYKKQAISFILNNPSQYLMLAVKRAVITYKAETIGIHWNGSLQSLSNTSLNLLKGVSSAYWWLVLLLAFYGFYRTFRDKKLGLFHILTAITVYFFIFPILTVGQDRYHLATNPFLAIYAAYALHMLYINFEASRKAKLQ